MSSEERRKFEYRKQECKKIMAKYPDKLPVIVDRLKNTDPQLDKTKFLCPNNITIQDLISIVRARLEKSSIMFNQSHALFFFIDNKIIVPFHTLNTLYREHANEDGYLYITYSKEETFGRN